MYSEDSEEVQIDQLRMTDCGEAHVNAVAQGAQTKDQSCHEPSVIHTTYACIQPETKHNRALNLLGCFKLHHTNLTTPFFFFSIPNYCAIA